MSSFTNNLVLATAIATVLALTCKVGGTLAATEGTALPAEKIAQPPDATTAQLSAIEDVSNDILKVEIQMMKASANFHAAWLKPNRWKSWRLFLYKTADSALTNAGMITIAASRYAYIDDPSKAPRSFLKAGHIVNLTAASILACGTLSETLMDRISDHRIAKKKQDPKSALSEFLRLRKNLDDLLVERSVLLAKDSNLSQCQKDIIEADGLVLQDMRELVSNEFYNAYCEVAKLRGVRDTSNATALFSAVAAGYAGSLQSLLSVANYHPQQTGVAGIGFITAGSSVAATPLLVKLGGSLASRRAENKLKQSGVTKIMPQDQFDAHRARFEQLVSNAPPSETDLLTAIDARNTIYKLHNEILDARDQGQTEFKRQARRDLAERLFFSSIVGGTNIARGSTLAVAGFKYPNDPTTNFKLAAAASTVFIAGSGVWTADNIQSKVREELREKKFKAGKLSVHGKLLQDLEDLQEMEDQMSTY